MSENREFTRGAADAGQPARSEASILPLVRDHFRSVVKETRGHVDAGDPRYVALHGTSVQALAYLFQTGFLPGMTYAEVPSAYRPRDISAVPTPHTPGVFQEFPVDAIEAGRIVRVEARKVAERHAFLATLGIPLDDAQANEMARASADRIWDHDETAESDAYFAERGFSDVEIQQAVQVAASMKGVVLGIKSFGEGDARKGEVEEYHLFIQPQSEEGFPSSQFNGIEALGESDKDFLESALAITLPTPEIPTEDK